MARQHQEADRLAQIRQLEGRQAELDRRIARLEERLAGQQGAMLRNPLNVHGAFAGVAGLSQTQAEIDQARAERLEVTHALQRLRKAAAVSANTPVIAEPIGGDGTCRPGGTCAVLSLTLFCRTPQQLLAILSPRPGPGRKQVVNVLSASGDCRQVPAGQALQWTAPMVIVHPQGEPAAELVPGTLQDGLQGFMLRDGVIARVGTAAR